MPLNKVKTDSNMYQGWCTHTWNPIKGRCSHNCTYCYMHRFWKMMPDDTLRLDEKELKTNLGENNFIFVGSSTDMWADNIKLEWVMKILRHIKTYPKNVYLFQTKNPNAWRLFTFPFSTNTVLGITLETNRNNNISKAQNSINRVEDFIVIEHSRKMVTVEPIMDFDLSPFVSMIKSIEPEWVNIGADSGGNKLPEPPKEKVLELIDELKMFTVVKNKTNLKRLIGEV